MVLLLTVSILLFFISYNMGGLAVMGLERALRLSLPASWMDKFICGLILQATLFNIISFFRGVNYWVLIPLLLVSVWFWIKHSCAVEWKASWQRFATVLFSPANVWMAVCFLVVFVVYMIVPPMNYDSGDYHYASINWYEQYKVIPGLANVHGRLGFNPTSFIIGSAYAFSDVVHQSLYPLNVVLVLAFYAWLLYRIFLYRQTWWSIVYAVLAIAFYRPLLANTSSPSSEPLVLIVTSYVFLQLMQRLQERRTEPAAFVLPVLLTVFVCTAKISSTPMLLLLPLIFFVWMRPANNWKLMLQLFVLSCIILAPWLARNIIMSGYWAYPLPITRLPFFDWTVPEDVALLDYTFSHYGPRTFWGPYQEVLGKPFSAWVPVWFRTQFADKRWIDFTIFMMAACSPLYWLFSKRSQERKLLFQLWAVALICCAAWFLGSPEYRFGMAFLLMAFALPALYIAKTYALNKRLYMVALSFLFAGATVYYTYRAFYDNPQMYAFGIKDIWLKPLKDKRYNTQSAIDFPYTTLSDGTKLYHQDSIHTCLNAPGPCMNWPYGTIVLRGNTIEDGFKNIDCNVRSFYPFIIQP